MTGCLAKTKVQAECRSVRAKQKESPRDKRGLSWQSECENLYPESGLFFTATTATAVTSTISTAFIIAAALPTALTAAPIGGRC